MVFNPSRFPKPKTSTRTMCPDKLSKTIGSAYVVFNTLGFRLVVALAPVVLAKGVFEQIATAGYSTMCPKKGVS